MRLNWTDKDLPSAAEIEQWRIDRSRKGGLNSVGKLSPQEQRDRIQKMNQARAEKRTARLIAIAANA